MFTFDGWVTRVAFELHWALETRLHASAPDSELFLGVPVDFFLDRWDSQVPPYVIISDVPWCVYYCSKDFSLYYLYFVYMAHCCRPP